MLPLGEIRHIMIFFNYIQYFFKYTLEIVTAIASVKRGRGFIC